MDEATGLDEAPGLDEATDGVPDLSLRRGLRLLPALTVLLVAFVVYAWATQLDSPHTRVRPRAGPRTMAAPGGGCAPGRPGPLPPPSASG